jgi:hypothetical protein
MVSTTKKPPVPVAPATPAYLRHMGGTTGAQLLLVGYAALNSDEQEEAFALIRDARLSRQAEGEGEIARMVRSLRRAAEHTAAGSELTVDEYRQAVRDLKESNDPIEPLSRVLRFFDGSWRQAREACLVLAEGKTDRLLTHRLAQRKVGKIWRWRPETLASVLTECCKDHGGRPVRVSEFDWWRQQRVELAEAQGDTNFHLPCAGAYRRVWKTWDRSLVECCGFTEAEAKQRFEPVAGER